MSITGRFRAGVGERIKSVRMRAMLDQKAMADKFDITRQSVNGYENERLMPSAKVIEAIAVEFGINPAWLMYGAGVRELSDSYDVDQEREKKLTSTQRALVEYIKSDKDAAAKMAKQLWDRALKTTKK